MEMPVKNWSSMESEKSYELFLIEHMDFLLEEARGERAQNLVAIARLLADNGIDRYSGICIGIDKEKSVFEYGPPIVRY